VSRSSDAGSTLHGPRDQGFGTTVSVTLDDGTVYADAHALAWLPAAEVVQYTSDAPAAVEVGSDGALVLRANHETLVSVTAQACAGGPSAVAVAANLQAPFRGVDLGSNVGLQFEVSAGSVAVPVLVNAVGAKLTSFQLVVEFDDSQLRASGYTEGVRAAAWRAPSSAARA